MNLHNDIGVFRGEALLVCSANVCRSPLAELTMTATSRDVRLPIRFSSAGIEARAGETMCHAAARGLPEEPAGHEARRIDATAVTSSDLILVMELEQRGQVARVAPGSQSRTFTLREAVALLDLAAAQVVSGEKSRVSSLAEVAAMLHGLRGRLPLNPPSRRRKEVHSTTSARLSIEDGHNRSASGHAATIAEVRSISVRLIDGLKNVLVEAPTLRLVDSEEAKSHAAA